MTLTTNQSLPLCWPTARAASDLKELIVWRSKPWLEHPEAILGAEIQGHVQPAPEMSRLLPTQTKSKTELAVTAARCTLGSA